MTASPPSLSFRQIGDRRLAYRLRKGKAPTLVFLPGYASDMEGAKAFAIDSLAADRGLAMLRFDYSGTGSSDGTFEDGTLENWIKESIRVLDELTEGPVVPIGSSMGGWIALHLALQRPNRVQALVGIAAAPDFTDWGFTAEQKSELLSRGRLGDADPSGNQSQLITRGFWESAESLRLLDGPIAVECPVRLIHGEMDGDVPVAIAMRLMRQLRSADVQLHILKGGGHRLSEPPEIDAILRTVGNLVESTR